MSIRLDQGSSSTAKSTGRPKTNNTAGTLGDCAPAALQEFDVVVTGRRRFHEQIKRIFDIILSTTLLILFSPFLVLAAVAIKLTSPGPVFFSQIRAGLGNKRFRMLKLRSMRSAEVVEPKPGDVFIKVENDPRLTLVGRIIRKTSIDELPQLINVFFGEMSLIGPRPLIPAHLLVLEPTDEQFRARMKPGLTGLWQLRDREHASSALSMISHDREYIEQFSLWLDLKILLKTIPAVLSCRGAK